MWTKTVEELLERLRDTIPGDGMIGEVHYWRDLCRVLDGITSELKQPQVELTVQILLSVNDQVISKDVQNFTKQKSRVLKGAKEARWNNKYMKIIEKPVKQIEQASELLDIQMVIIALLKSLKNIYQNSNFYKEARIVSFVDRLLEKIKSKLQGKLGLQKSLMLAIKNYEQFQTDIDQGKSIIKKFLENFFISELMDESNKMKEFGGSNSSQ